MDDETFDAAAFQAISGASSTEMADLHAYKALIGQWGERMNLVGPSALTQFWPRHAWDSAQLLDLAPTQRVWADVGAGAGFPGLVLAIFLKRRPGSVVHLVESITKRCRFLEAAAETLRLPVVVHNARAEHTRIEGLEVVTARACAPMVRLLGFVEPMMRGGAEGLFLKGRDVEAEIQQALASWRFTAELIPSRSGEGGNIVKVKRINRV